jgi:polyferredoxin
VTFWRRLVQVGCFAFFVYGGWLVAVAFTSSREAGQSVVPKGSLVWTQGSLPLVDAYPPSAVCRFTSGGRAVAGCIVALLSESLTVASSARTVLPYLLVFVLLSFLVGRLWCGWVCPLSALGDFLNALRRWLGRDFFQVGAAWRRRLRSGAYGLLGGTLAISWLIRPERYKATWQCWLFLPFCQVCPARLACPLVAGAGPTSWGAFTHPVQAFMTVASWAVLGLFLVAFVAARRLWCHLCPIGLATSWFNRGSPLELTKEATRCNRCGACADACPMSLTHVRDEKEHAVVNSPECILCLRYVEVCPRDDCLALKFARLPIVRSRFKVAGGARPAQQAEEEVRNDVPVGV